MKNALLLVGRVLFSWYFILAAWGHFTQTKSMAGWVASKGLPMPEVGVVVGGVMILLGGLSILLGYKTEIGGWLLFFFLVPVAFLMHDFWTVTDPMMRGFQFANFGKNIVLAGASIHFALRGPGPWSLEPRD